MQTKLSPYGLAEVIYDQCLEYFRESDLRQDVRFKNTAKARHVLCYCVYKLSGLSLKESGGFLARDHTTILNSIKRVEASEELLGRAAWIEECVSRETGVSNR